MPPAADAQSKPRLGAIEGIRGIAAVGIVVLHGWLVSGRPTDVLSASWWGPLRMAVPLFFVLSGYFAMAPWLRAALDGADPPAARDALLKRAARIFPVFWISGAVAFVILAGTGSYAMPDAKEALAYALMLQDWVPGATGKLNPPTWTLPIELSFTIVLPLIGWLMLRFTEASRERILGLIFLFWLGGLGYCVWFDMADAPRAWARTVMLMMPSFAAGMGAAVIFYKRTMSVALARTLMAGGFAVFIWYLAGPLGHLQASLPFRDVIPALCFGAIVAGAAGHGPRWLGGTTLVWLGSRSFGLYLWHYPMIFLLTEHLGWPGQFWGTAIALTLGLILAELTFHTIERPIGGWLTTRRRAAH